ncbi:NAD(P)/FAD-dependent oxidoreductase [Thiohalorhabdus sp.]|uniref:NAD(P)/FAD-dependent oxidoreductase n=1 Tax=Thiohalorhabdus sp. TaxID=3094134 RepID=UPI002FC2BB50
MRILILGAGYAGLRAALDLGHARARDQLPEATEITLVERADCHHLIFWLHQVAGGTISSSEACVDFADLPLDQVTFKQAEVRGIDPRSRSVATSAGELGYGHLVLALGSEATLPQLPGLAEHAHTLRDPARAETLHTGLGDAFAQAGEADTPGECKRLATVAVAGGGFTGCQLAGELAHRLPELADRSGVAIRHVRLVLLEAGERLLPAMDACHGRSAQRILEAKGVEVWTGAALERVDGDTLTAGGSRMPYGTLAWAGGVAGPGLLGNSGLDRNRQGRVWVDRFLRATDFPEVRAAGDCAVRQDDPGTEATATEALNQGRYLAATLRDELAGRTPDSYRPSRLGLLVALGNNDAVGNAGPVPLAGRPAGVIKNGAERTYPDTLRGNPPQSFQDWDFGRPR